MMKQPKILKHLCGQCSKTFKSETAYLTHLCSVTGHSPKEPQHFNPETQVYPETVSVKKKTTKLPESYILEAVNAARQAKK